jgi:hypothetical protein
MNRSLVAYLACSLFGLSGLAMLGPNPALGEGEKGKAALVERCHELREQAYDHLNRMRRRDEKVSPKIRGYALLGEAIELCWRATSEVSDPAAAAELAAQVFLDKNRLLTFEGTREDRRKVLAEGISVVSGLHNDRSPALIELLEKGAFAEWTAGNDRYGDRLLRQAIEIARETYGPEDPRVADKLASLGFLYAPSSTRGVSPRASDDPQKAEALLQEALKIHLRQPDPLGSELYSRTLVHYLGLLEAVGRQEEAEAMHELLNEYYREEERRRATAEEEKAAGEPTPESADEGSGDG